MPTDPDRDILVRPVMTASTGLPEDAVTNDFAFHANTDVADGSLPVFAGWVSDFYRATQDNGLIVSSFISNEINRGATHEIQVYRIQADGSTGSPAYTEDWLGPVTTSNVNAMPTEVAGVLSMHADLTGALEEVGATRPRARRRGRLFIGPLNQDAVQYNTPPYRLATAFLATLRQAAVALCDASQTDPGVSDDGWSVWSRTDGVLRAIRGGWTDNAPDTQRRRGVASNARVVWTA